MTLFLSQGSRPECLGEAVSSGNRQIVLQLLAAGINPSQELVTALTLPEPDMAIFLLENGAGFQQDFETLDAAIQRDDPTLLRRLLNSSRSDLDSLLMSEGIYLALKGKKHTVVQILLLYTPRIDRRSEVLREAVSQGNLSLIQTLLARGANADLVSGDYGYASLLEDAATGDLEIIKALYMHGGRYRLQAALKRAAYNSDPGAVDFFLKHAAEQKIEECLLCEAAKDDHLSKVAQLLAQGDDIDAVNNWGGPLYGMSALTVASLYANPEVVEYLLAHGASLQSASNLIYRIVREPLALMRYRTGVNFSSDVSWQRDLANYGRLIRLFMAKGLDINALIEDETALMAAVKAKSYPFVKLLLEAGANPAVKNSMDMSALDIALTQDDQAIISLLGHSASKP